MNEKCFHLALGGESLSYTEIILMVLVPEECQIQIILCNHVEAEMHL